MQKPGNSPASRAGFLAKMGRMGSNGMKHASSPTPAASDYNWWSDTVAATAGHASARERTTDSMLFSGRRSRRR